MNHAWWNVLSETFSKVIQADWVISHSLGIFPLSFYRQVLLSVRGKKEEPQTLLKKRKFRELTNWPDCSQLSSFEKAVSKIYGALTGYILTSLYFNELGCILRLAWVFIRANHGVHSRELSMINMTCHVTLQKSIPLSLCWFNSISHVEVKIWST